MTRPRGPSARAIVQERRNHKLGWVKAIGELIDNSAGNGAQRVLVRFKPHHAEVRDDGVGCTEEMFAAMVSYGWHQEDESVDNSVSRYGVGANHAFMWVGGPTEAYSARDGAYRYTAVDWDAFEDEWDYDEPIVGKAAKRKCAGIGLKEHGTVVVMPYHARQMNEKHFEDVVKQLNRMFWAAVDLGVDIRLDYRKSKGNSVSRRLNGKPLPAFIDDQTIETSLPLEDGRLVHIAGGVLSPEVRMTSPGFEYIYGHRVLLPACGLGAGDLDFERIYFRVRLAGDKADWDVTTNKTGLHDADEAALGQAVFDRCRPLLEHSQSEAVSSLIDKQLLDQLSNLVSAAQRKKAKRKSPDDDTPGAVTPTGRGSPHQRARALGEQEGGCESTEKHGRISLKMTDFPEEEKELVARACIRDRIIRFNRLHPFVAHHWGERNLSSLVAAANAVWAETWTRTEASGQKRCFEKMPFLEKYSAMMKVAVESHAVSSA